MLRYGKLEVAKEEFYRVKKAIEIWVVNVGNIVISKVAEIENNSKYVIECLYLYMIRSYWKNIKTFGLRLKI